MSPEERAEAVRDDPRWFGTDNPPADFVRLVASAIRAAEDEAIERAAKRADRWYVEQDREPHSPGHAIRSLKSGSVKGDRDGR